MTARGAGVATTVADPGLRLPATITPLGYELRLELDPEVERFAGRVTIRVRLDAPADRVWLHADELEITKATYTGARSGELVPIATSGAHEMRAFGFGGVVPAGEVVLELAYEGHVGDAQEGLFRQRTGGRWFLYSQAEATYARRFVPCFDEPRFKVPWRVTAVVPRGQTVIGNAPIESEHELADHRREVRFVELAGLPTYLLAIAVGPFAIVDAGVIGKGRIPLRLAVAPADRKRVASALVWVPRLVDALEAYLDEPLPWPKLDLVAVPRFFGAMENPGLITFEVSALVGDPDDPVFLRRHIRFLAHELAHQWLGNAVTPAWWDDLWLSEAFATWFDDKLASALGPLDDGALRTQLARAHALAADREPGARPLRRAITSNDDIEEAFDAISYEKGAAVIAMFEDFVGPDRFRQAVRAYVRMRRGQSAVAADFVAALATATSTPIAKAFASYLDHAGAPVVDLVLRCDPDPATPGMTLTMMPALAIEPRGDASVPVCVRYAGRTGATRTCILATGTTRLALDATTCPAWITGNAGGRGYYHVHWKTPVRGAAPAVPAEQLADGEDRAAALERGELAGHGAIAELVALVATRDPYADLAALAIAAELDHVVDDAAAPRWRAWLAARLARRLTRRALWVAQTPVERALRDAVTGVITGEHFDRPAIAAARQLVARALARAPYAIRADELAIALVLAAPAGGKPMFERIVAAAAASPASRDEWLEGLGWFGPALAPRAVELVLDERFEPDEAWAAVGGMLARPATRTAAWRAIRARLPELLAALSDADATTVVQGAASLCDTTARAEVAAAFEPHLAAIVDGRATLTRTLAAIDRCAARRAALGDLAAALP